MKGLIRGCLAVLVFTLPSIAQPRLIDTQRSSVTIHLDKSGIFSFAGHNHVIGAPIGGGEVITSDKPSVQIWFSTSRMRVLDPELSDNKRAEIQQTMEGPDVLDVKRYPEIRFRSTVVDAAGAGKWTVRGILALHGQTREVKVDVEQNQDHYRGTATFRQTGFGITPVRVAGGTVKVKDQVKIEFVVFLVQ